MDVNDLCGTAELASTCLVFKLIKPNWFLAVYHSASVIAGHAKRVTSNKTVIHHMGLDNENPTGYPRVIMGKISTPGVVDKIIPTAQSFHTHDSEIFLGGAT